MKKKYYRKRDNNFYLDKTKEEILSEIDYDNPETFLPYLEILDYPYLEYEWNYRLRFGREHNLNNIFGRYIALMRLKGYRDFSYQDSNHLNDLRKKNDTYEKTRRVDDHLWELKEYRDELNVRTIHPSI